MNSEIIERLKDTKEMDPDKHDGSYELMRATVEAYRDVDENELDYKDLNTVYLMSVGTWKHGVPVKKETIEKSHLAKDLRERLYELLDELTEKSRRGEYSNHKGSERALFGMFGTGFYKKHGDGVRAFTKRISACSH